MRFPNIAGRNSGRTQETRDLRTHDANRAEPGASTVAAGRMVRGDVAIIGMACLFPGAPNVDAYWRNILSKVSAITDPPPEAWDADMFYDPDSSDPDKVYCKKGGYITDLTYFDALANFISPRAVAGGEPDQWLSLQLARDALADAGYDELERAVRMRTAVILGKGTYINAGNGNIAQHCMNVGQIIEILKTLHPELTADQIAALREDLKRSLPPLNAETVTGLVPNIIVGRIANKLDLMGPSYTVDGACASSLIAVQHAIRDLLTGECDLALAGGSQITTSVPTLNLFCQLGALSRRQELRPFDKDADGTLLGEGIGIVVLKRLADAERDGDRIYAVIKGVGVASDGRGVGVMAPRIEGEVLALERAYTAAGVSPRSIELIEAHGTGTPVGDVVEVQALTQVFGGRDGQLPRCALGSVKSMISHTMPAAGVAGVIKAALALHHKVLPPTLNCAQPNPKLEIEKTPFYINTETRPWIHGANEPRRAGVNAFGFGGINAHLVLEEYRNSAGADGPSNGDESGSPVAATRPTIREMPGHLLTWDSEVCVFEGDSRAALIEKMRTVERYLALTSDDIAASRPPQPAAVSLADVAWTLSHDLNRAHGPFPDRSNRLAVVATSLGDLRAKLSKAAKRLEDPTCRQIKDAAGIYYAAQPLARASKLALLFPGEGAQYPNMLADLCLHFPEVREEFDRIDRVYADHRRGYVPSDYIFPRPAFSDEERSWAEQHLWSMSGAVESVLTANWAVYCLLARLGIRPDAIVGHSTGDYSAMRAVGFTPIDNEAQLAQATLALAQGYETASSQEDAPRAGMLAVGADRSRVEAIASEVGGNIFVAMDNCPHQVVLVGDASEIERAVVILRRESLIYEQLSFDRAYHTPLFRPYVDLLQQTASPASEGSPHFPIYSCTTSAPYPSDPAVIRELAIEHWIRPVEFRRTIEAMYADGVRIFVEAGPRGNLTAFTEDILRGREFVASAANVQRRSGITQLNHLLAVLIAHGVDPDLAYLFERRQPRFVTWESAPDSGRRQSSDVRVKLPTGFPKMVLSADLAGELRDRVASVASVENPVEMAGPSNTTSAFRDASAESGIAVSGDAPTSRRSATFPPDWLSAGPPGDQPHAFSPDNAPAPDLSAANGSSETDVADGLALGQSAPKFWDDHESQILAETRTLAWAPPPEGTTEYDDRPGDIDDLGERTAAIQSFLSTMEEFLSVQNQVMQAYLAGGANIPVIDPVLHLGPAAVPAESELASPPTTSLPSSVAWATTDTPMSSVEWPIGASPPARTSKANSQATRPDGLPGANRPLPLLGNVVSLIPNEEVVVERVFDPAEDLYLRDHTLGRSISTTDPELLALAVLPLAMSLEILAEAAACLVPDRVIVGLRNVRAHRWIAFDDEPQRLQTTARRTPGATDAVIVFIRNLTEDRQSDAPVKSPAIEATVVFAQSYLPRPPVRPIELIGARSSYCRSDRLYSDIMFHGPSWRGVAAIDETGDNGSIATLPILPRNGFFRSQSNVSFILDPVVLDAAGQVIGFWTMEHLPKANLIFPFRLEALNIYGDQRPSGEVTTCAASIHLVGEQQVRSDIDIFDTQGGLWMRLVGWEDKRFDLPTRFHPLLLSPRRAEVSTAWPEVVARLPGAERIQCRRVSASFTSDRSFWKRVWANCILSRDERDQFRQLRAPENRQFLWLAGRMAAKEAVQRLLRDQYGLDLLPADIEIGPDDRGCPLVGGAWRNAVPDLPVISIAHADDVAVALAAFPRDGGGRGGKQVPLVGIDIEKVPPLPGRFSDVAFTVEERLILHSLKTANPVEWELRCWCAKEAAAKALGYGLAERPGSVLVTAIDLASERVAVHSAGRLAKLHADLAGTDLIVNTSRQEDLAVATIVWEAGEPNRWP